MGKGDQRSKRGKIVAGTHGKTRPKKKNVKKAENTENKSEKKDQ